VTVRHIVPLGDFEELASLRALTREAESLGVSTLLLEERLGSQLDPVVTIAALLTSNPTISLGMMLSAHSGRAPSVLAKLVSGLDLVSGGRTHLVLGDLDDAPGETLAGSAEQVELIREMLTHDVTTFVGPAYRVDSAWNTPRISGGSLTPDKICVAYSRAQLEWIARTDHRGLTAFVIGCSRSTWNVDEPAFAEVLANSGAPFIGALVDIENDVASAIAFAALIAGRFAAVYLRWPTIPTESELVLSSQLG